MTALRYLTNTELALLTRERGSDISLVVIYQSNSCSSFAIIILQLTVLPYKHFEETARIFFEIKFCNSDSQ